MIDGGDHSSKTRSSLSTMDMFQEEPVCWACLNFLVLRLGSNGFTPENLEVFV